MTRQDPKRLGTPGLAPWAQDIVENLERLGALVTEEPLSALTLSYAFPEGRIRRFVQRLGGVEGLHAVYDFIRRALYEPDQVVREIQEGLGRRLTRRYRERLEAAVRAHGLAIIRIYGLRSYFHAIVYLCFNQGENDVPLIAEYLATLVGPREATRKLCRKLTSNDPELREYVIYLLAEFADHPFFVEVHQRIYDAYLRERNSFVREAFEYLFDFRPQG